MRAAVRAFAGRRGKHRPAYAATAFHKSTGLFPDPPSYGAIIDSSLISAAISQAGS